MLIGVFSDIHDNLTNLDRALETFNRHGVGTLIFCGDFCSPIPARVVGRYEGHVHCVFGNGDGDRFTILRWASEHAPNMTLYGEHADLNLGGRRIAVTHYPFYGQALARTGDYDAVFSGHTHEQHHQRLADCLWLNPGEILGWKGKPSFAVYDTSSGNAAIEHL